MNNKKDDKIIEGEVVKEDEIVVKKEEDKAIIPSAQNLLLLSEALHQSGMFPNVKNKFGALAIIEYGRELGLQPVIALQTMSVINGRICVESKAMLGMAQKNGIKHEIIEKTREGSTVQFTKSGSEPYTETFTIEDAEKLGFTNKINWKMYPEEMCFWRCIAKGLRAYAPDAILGLYSKEEMLDVGDSFNSKPKKEIIKKKTEPKKEEPATDEQRKEIQNSIAKLVELGQDTDELDTRMKGYIKNNFKVEVKKIPDDLNSPMADKLLKNLKEHIALIEIGDEKKEEDGEQGKLL